LLQEEEEEKEQQQQQQEKEEEAEVGSRNAGRAQQKAEVTKLNIALTGL
jgi:hypothetical protein